MEGMFLVWTDSLVVKAVLERAEPTENERMKKWLVELRDFDLTIQHLKGKDNGVTDVLSRSPVNVPLNVRDDYVGALQRAGYAPRELAILQQADEDIRKMVLTVQEIGERPFEEMSEFVLKKGILYKRSKIPGRQFLLVVPSILRQDLIREYHDAPNGAHHGREKTLARLSQRFFWSNMDASVRHYVRSCPFCQNFKPRVGKMAGKLCPIKPPRHIAELWGIDHLGPFKTSALGNKHLIVAIDYLSRYVETRPETSTDLR